MVPRNYFIKALDALTGYEDTPVSEDFNCLKDYLMTGAQCWHLEPHVLEMIWNTEIDPSLFETLRLPMPLMAVEYDFEHSLLHLGPPKEGRMECPPRCTIMADSTALGIAFLNLYGADRKDLQNWIEGIIVYQFFTGEHHKTWQLIPYMTLIPYSELAAVASVFSGDQYEMPLRMEGLVPGLTLDFMAQQLSMDTDTLVADLVHLNPMMDDIRVCFGLLQLMQCHNVPVTTLSAPAKLNRKRVARGKAPLPSYRAIRISGAPQRQHTAATGADHRASPRAHMRRGHVRRQFYPSQQTHKNRWIMPTLIGGDKPIIRDVVVK
jgi:hypothetical protein